MEHGPQINIESLIVKTLIENGKTIHRHFFKWSDRKTENRLEMRINLYTAEGKPVCMTQALTLPKEKKDRPISRFFSIDAPMIAYGFSYSTTPLLGKASQVEVALISEKREDLSLF